MPDMSPYEKQALRAIAEWKNPRRSWLDSLGELAEKPLDFATSKVMDTGVGEVMNKAINGALLALNDMAAATVRQDGVFSKFREAGHSVGNHRDIFQLELAQVDRVVGNLGMQYMVPAFGEGAATGMAGIVGIAADVPLLFGINLRAIADHATHYGFDVGNQAERAYILHVLMYSSAPTGAEREACIKSLDRISRAVTAEETWEELEKVLSKQIVKKAADVLAKRLTKAKAGQAIPVAGAIVGGGFNAWFTRSNCDAAYHLYRERFLKRRYGLG
ncbi:MAG: EcsC family protein [Candidatus Sericytochromatia bacterium]